MEVKSQFSLPEILRRITMLCQNWLKFHSLNWQISLPQYGLPKGVNIEQSKSSQQQLHRGASRDNYEHLATIVRHQQHEKHLATIIGHLSCKNYGESGNYYVESDCSSLLSLVVGIYTQVPSNQCSHFKLSDRYWLTSFTYFKDEF